jgi:hypothetical protein
MMDGASGGQQGGNRDAGYQAPPASDGLDDSDIPF